VKIPYKVNFARRALLHGRQPRLLHECEGILEECSTVLGGLFSLRSGDRSAVSSRKNVHSLYTNAVAFDLSFSSA
jgi:hypothetical protein